MVDNPFLPDWSTGVLHHWQAIRTSPNPGIHTGPISAARERVITQEVGLSRGAREQWGSRTWKALVNFISFPNLQNLGKQSASQILGAIEVFLLTFYLNRLKMVYCSFGAFWQTLSLYLLDIVDITDGDYVDIWSSLQNSLAREQKHCLDFQNISLKQTYLPMHICKTFYSLQSAPHGHHHFMW